MNEEEEEEEIGDKNSNCRNNYQHMGTGVYSKFELAKIKIIVKH